MSIVGFVEELPRLRVISELEEAVAAGGRRPT
jgi:hypothetical protein